MIESQHFGTGDLPIHPGRYRLVVSPTCPWCRMTTITRRLLGLEAAIPASFATGVGPDGFEFIADGYSFDPVLRARTQREIYRRQEDWQPGDPTTVPLIIDSKNNDRIICTESHQILIDFCTVWETFWEWGVTDLYPQAEREQIDALDQWMLKEVFRPIGKLVHDQANDEHRKQLAEALQELDNRLGGANEPAFLFGTEPRLSDVRLFAQLSSLFLKQAEALADYPHLAAYRQRLWDTPGWVGPEERAVLDPDYVAEDDGAGASAACAAPACSA